MMQRFLLAVGVPILAMVVIAAIAGSLGVTFMYLHHVMHNEWGVIILGMALVSLRPCCGISGRRMRWKKVTRVSGKILDSCTSVHAAPLRISQLVPIALATYSAA